MAQIWTFTGLPTASLVGTENITAGQTFDPATATAWTIIVSDNDPSVEGDVINEAPNDAEGDQFLFIRDENGNVTSDGNAFYVEMSFQFTVGGQTFTGYQLEDDVTGVDFVILPPDIPAGTINVDSINFNPAPNEANYFEFASGDENADPTGFTNLDLSDQDDVRGGTGDDTLMAGAGSDNVYAGDGDDSVEGGSGGDRIIGGAGNDTLLGQGGDDVITGDGGSDSQATRLSFNWSQIPDPDDGGVIDDGDTLANTFTQDTGGIDVDVTFTDLGNGTPAFTYEGNQAQNVDNIDSGSETINSVSAARVASGGNATAGVDVASVTFDFSANNGTFSDDVNNVSFRVNDLDESGWLDRINIQAFDSSGQSVPVVITGSAEMTVSDSDAIPGNDQIAVNEGAGNTNSVDADASLLFEVPGPVSQIIVTYGNDDVGGQLIDITDVFFDAVPATPTVSGDDVIDAGSGDDIVYGQLGNDSILGGIGDDTLVGDVGDDTIVGGSGSDSISGGDDADTIFGDASGTAGNGSASPFLYEWYDLDGQSPATLADAGFDANADNSNTPDATGTTDTIDAPARDLAEGGDGETYAVKYTTVLTVTEEGTYDFSTTSDDGSKLFINGVEIVSNDGLHGVETQSGSTPLTAGEHLVEIIFFENTLGDTLEATISGPDTGNTAIALENADVSSNSPLLDQTYDDTIDAGAGDDLVQGGQGDDSIIGGDGADTLCGDDRSDTLDGGIGDDALEGGAGTDSLVGGLGVDTLAGGADADTLEGGDGNDSLNGDSILKDPADFASSAPGAATDITFVNNADSPIETWLINTDGTLTQVNTLNPGDTVTEASFVGQNYVFRSPDGSNLQIIEAGQGQTWPYGNENLSDSLQGGNGDDVLNGLYGDDTLDGGIGDDTLLGSYGADVLNGGSGRDSITLTDGDTATGGTGADVFVVTDEDNSASTIVDFDPTTGVTGVDPTNQADNDFADLSGFFSGLTEMRAANLSAPGDDIVIDLGDGQTVTFAGVTDINLLNFENVNVICFARGTTIRTASGDRLIEDLVEGDLVQTMDNGLQPLRWIGSSHLGKPILELRPNLQPIEIAAGTLGNHQPLTVSPQHRVLIEGKNAAEMFGEHQVFVPAKHLINDTTIRSSALQEVEYFHMLFDRHEVVFANGAAAESLHPGLQATRSMTSAMRAEIYEIFPELELAETSRPLARRSLRRREAIALLSDA